MRVTGPLLRVLTALVEEPGDEVYGLEILRRTGLKSGTLYPILDRLVEAGWVSARWEDEPGGSGPRRRFYRLTGEGRHEAHLLFLEHSPGVVSGHDRQGRSPGLAARGPRWHLRSRIRRVHELRSC